MGIFDFVGKRYWYFAFSLLIILPGLVSLLIPPAFHPGIEFTSGSSLTIQFSEPVDHGDLRAALARRGHSEAIIQRTGEGAYLVRTRTLRDAPPAAEAAEPSQPGEKEQLLAALKQDLVSPEGRVELVSFDSVSPVIAEETIRNSVIQVAVASVAILLYITWAFRSLPKPFRYGVCAIVALLHDVLVVLGLFSIFGKLFGTEIDSLFITAMLTVIGFSVHDTIVVFDRIRENLRRYEREPFGTVVNVSLTQTLARSLNTSITTLLAMTALLLFGGPTIRTFVLALIIGITSGSYSSIFNAAQLLVAWESRDIPHYWRRFRPAPAAVPAKG